MTNERPNVVLLLQDQLRYDTVMDSTLCHTPAQDALRRQGTTLRNHYAPMAVCSPSRASLLTGLYPHGNGVMNNMNGTDAFLENLPTDIPNVAEQLRSGGYRTGYVGKWHLGPAGPASVGFDDVGSLDADLLDPTGRFAPCWARFHERAPDTVRSRYPEPTSRHAARFTRRPFPMYSTQAVAEEAIPARAVTDEAIDLVRGYAHEDAPFFLMVSYLEPHWPNVLPEPYASMYDPADMEPWPNLEDDFRGKPRTLAAARRHFGVEDFTWDDWAPLIARYLGAVSFVDELVGRVVGTIDALGIGDNTLVISTCDHGDFTGSHGQFNKGPMAYEEIYRIPFIARWPAGLSAGAEVDELTSHIDVMPTILDATGLTAPGESHGHSVLGLMHGRSGGWRDALMCEHHGDEFGLYTQRMLRHDRFKLVYNPHDVLELYDLETDPFELTNLADDPAHADVRRDLEARLLEIMHDTDDPHRLYAVNTLG